MARGDITRNKIAQAAIRVLAAHGLAGVSYRLVAKEARLGLAVVSYHYPRKFDMIRAASAAILDHYSNAFARAARRLAAETGAKPSFRDFAFRLLRNASNRDRIHTLAWAEIALDAVRHEESLALAVDWNDQITTLWHDIADAIGETRPHQVARSGIDVIMGLLFVTAALELSEAQLDAVLLDNKDPACWRDTSPAPSPDARSPGRKAAGTRSLILSAAIDLLVAEGPAAVGYRAIAERTGLAIAAPAYHFATIDALLSAAQETLFARSGPCDLELLASAGSRAEPAPLADLAATIFIREATEFSGNSLARYAIWIEAARRPELRRIVWRTISDQHTAWRRAVGGLSPQATVTPRDGIIAFALFTGKLIRILSTGSRIQDLSKVRQEFEDDLKAIAQGSYWHQQPVHSFK